MQSAYSSLPSIHGMQSRRGLRLHRTVLRCTENRVSWRWRAAGFRLTFAGRGRLPEAERRSAARAAGACALLVDWAAVPSISIRSDPNRAFAATMAGHSQFKNIMHRKGRQDAVRSRMFAKLAREITVAAKTGVPEPDMNPRLRLAIQAARAENMPKDNIERAVKKASGGDTESYEAIRYEGYGPGGVAVIVEALTNNRNRTGGAIRAVFTKHGGNLGATGAVSHMFAHVGEIA